ncbi:hypothetical protein FQN57_007415 [Myotisia sp. PD_48]|nr:hypothetical protein FQN57_007415 [Myotisia sp. PD_48]
MRAFPSLVASTLIAALYGAIESAAQEQKPGLTLTGSNLPTSLSVDDPIPTDSSELYLSYQSTATVTPTELVSSNSSDSQSTTESNSVTVLVGSKTAPLTTSANGTTLSGNTTATETSSGATPTNTRPCNGYPEFCARSYSNITQVAAHNSPFVRPGNIASNQELEVTVQLNDGIRMLQFQTHYVDEIIYLCHSSCDLLNVGTLENYLTTVTNWLKANPYDVITVLIGNGGFIEPKKFIEPLEKSGLKDFAYQPPKVPMSLDDWPTLSELILTGKRAVVFMDYKAEQTAVPYLLDQFSQMWETPFSPTDRNFPCTVHRPPGLSDRDARQRLYMANHNLNTQVSIGGASLLIPNTVLLNETNAVSGFGSLEKWDRPPSALLVDYYNIGSGNGSVFQVAASLNNVTYNGKCCGRKTSRAWDSMFSRLFQSLGVAYLVTVASILFVVV